MEINITGKNIKITASLRNYINKKTFKLISDFEHPVNCDIVLEVEKKRHIIEIALSGDSGRFYFKKTADNLYKAIDNIIRVANISIKKFKQKQKNHKFKNKKNKKSHYTRKIIVKNLMVNNIKPMAIGEAVLQLKYIKQNILVFQNAKNFQTYILFKNSEGYNLIKPRASFFSKIFSKLAKLAKKNKYDVLLLTYKNNKISKTRQKKAAFDTLSYSYAYNNLVNNRNLNYLI